MAPLTPVEFAAAAAPLKMDDTATEAARRVLVEARIPTEIAKDLGVSRQMVSYWSGRVRNVRNMQVLAMADACPPGWDARVLALPTDEMLQIETRSKSALYTLSLEAKE